MERVKNGNCSISNKIGEKYLKCGPLYEYNRDVIAYPNYFPLCYSFSDRQIFSENNFRTRYLFPISLYGYSIVPTVLFGFEFIIILCVMVPSEYQQISKIREQNGFFRKFVFLCSLKNQIIFLSVFSSFIAFIFGFVSNFVYQQLYTIGAMIAMYLTFVQFVQIITLWAFFSSKSKNMAMDRLSKGQM
jgi:hypothetical protein